MNGEKYKTNINRFSTLEQGAITTNTNGDMRLLTIDEVKNVTYGFTNDERSNTARAASSLWWLRSPYDLNEIGVGVVNKVGNVYFTYIASADTGVRPAFNLNLNSVLFSSASGASKSSFASVGKDKVSANTWKLTLKDTNKTVRVQSGQSVSQSGKTVTVPYSYTGNIDQISIMITDKAYTESDASILYYGALDTTITRPDSLTRAASSEGEGTFTLPAGLSDGYKIYMMAEDVNGDTLTDYSSTPVEVILAISHTVSVTNGASTPSECVKGTTVKIKATSAPTGKVFDQWTSSDGVTFADATKEETTFEMLDKAVTVEATYKDKPVDPTTSTTKPTTPTKASITKASVSKIKAKTYTGYKMKPSVTVKVGSKKLKKGTDYTISYKNNIKVGTAKVIIKGKGNYTGTKTVTFKIKKRTKYAKGIYVVKSTGLYGHKGPSNQKKVNMYLKKGDKITITKVLPKKKKSSKYMWVKVKKNKKTSYVYSKYLKL